MAKALGVTMCLLSVCGEASNTRRCTCGLMRASVKPATPLDAISISTIPSVHIRALTARRPIRPTSPCCRSARRPNPGRGSTHRRGNSVQRIGTTALINDGDESCQYRAYDSTTGTLIPGSGFVAFPFGTCTGIDTLDSDTDGHHVVYIS